MRRGDTLAQALARGGMQSRGATLLATQFGKNGADLRRIRAGATIEITWNSGTRRSPGPIRGEPVALLRRPPGERQLAGRPGRDRPRTSGSRR